MAEVGTILLLLWGRQLQGTDECVAAVTLAVDVLIKRFTYIGTARIRTAATGYSSDGAAMRTRALFPDESFWI